MIVTKKVFLIFVFLIIFSVAGNAAFYDNFTDGNRDGWWKINDSVNYTLTVADDGSGIGSGNALFLTTDSNTRRAVAGFNPADLLNVDDFITLSFDIRLNGVTDTANALRFGLYSDRGTPVDADYSDASTSPTADDQGYYVRMGTGTGTTVEIYKDTDEYILGGSDASSSYQQYSGRYDGIDDVNKHHVDFTITRTASGMAFRLDIDGATVASASKSTTYPLIEYNEIAFASYNGGLDYVLDNVTVSYGTLFTDDFSDGNRDGWWKTNDSPSYSLTVTDDDSGIADGSALFLTTDSNTRRVLAGFAPTVSLSSGDFICLSFDMRLNGVTDTVNAFRFGLHSNRGTPMDADYSDVTTSPAADDQGYYVRLGTGTGTTVEVYKDTDEYILGGSDASSSYQQYSGSYDGINDINKHHIDFTITRTAIGMAFRLDIDGTTMVNRSKATAYPLTEYNQIGFASYNGGLDYVLDNVTVRYGTAMSDLTQAYVNTGGAWRYMNCRTLDSIEDYTVQPENMEFSKYGGWKTFQVQATGFFRVEKINGRWWAVDPEGYLYIHKALNAVNLNNYSPDEIYRLLPAYGFNGLGCWSDEAILQSSLKVQTPLAYCPKISFMAEYHAQRSPHLEMPVFDSGFESFCNSRASGFAKYADDPQVFGYFSDNELPWRDEGLAAHLAINDPGDENYATAIAFLAGRGKTPQNWDTGDRNAYMALMADRYYSVVRNAIRKYDTHHMYIGSRCNSTEKTIEDFIRNEGKYVDILSINHYSRWGARQVEIQNMSEWSGRPLLISEFYAMQDLDGTSVGAGWRVYDQPSRGLFYQNYITTMAETKDVVGFHWFKYRDDPDGDKGIIDENGNLYTQLLAKMAQANNQLYNFIDYTDRMTPDRVLTPEADAYFKGDENHGSDPDLWVKSSTYDYMRIAYLRFDLSQVGRKIKSAKIHLYSVAGGTECGSYQAELVDDDTWQEMKINGSNNPAGSTVLASWSSGGDVTIDVSAALLDALQDDNKLSIRILSTEDNGNIPQYGSRENPNSAARPNLCVYYEPANADFNHDGKVDLADFATLSSSWRMSGGLAADIAPAGGDDVVNTSDMMIFVEQWLLSR